MKTRFGEGINPKHVLEEYPRPQMRRQSYMNLNGVWHYAMCSGSRRPEKFDGEILVPFSPECPLSGAERAPAQNEHLWYERSFVLPGEFNRGRVLLHFGAVDQGCGVWVNGQDVGTHMGGYLPFELDITAALTEGDNRLTVRVEDVSDASFHSRGKQSSAPGGIWYTAQSGIWQTVWLESVPEKYVSGLKISPLYDASAVEITVLSPLSLPCGVAIAGRDYQGETNRAVRIELPDFTPWSPENPYLYEFEAYLGEDRVSSYFGMRKFSVSTAPDGYKRLYLNNRPYFHNGVLDQGYWPDGLLTPPSDEAMVSDILLMKRLGFNMLRKHIKIEPLRWYYHCDHLGMLVWQDMVNGGGAYIPSHISMPLILGNSHRDSDYGYFSRRDSEGRKEYLRERDETIRLLINCVSIAMWVPFNEGWGQFDAAQTLAAIQAMDPSRTVDHASGWHDQRVGDFRSMHVYFRPFRMPHDRLGRAVILSEFGGYAYRAEGHCFSDRAFGYKMLRSPEGLMDAYRKLYQKQIIPAKRKGLAASVYTQLSDVEMETNGFVSYDREVVKFPIAEVAALNMQLNDK